MKEVVNQYHKPLLPFRKGLLAPLKNALACLSVYLLQCLKDICLFGCIVGLAVAVAAALSSRSGSGSSYLYVPPLYCYWFYN